MPEVCPNSASTAGKMTTGQRKASPYLWIAWLLILATGCSARSMFEQEPALIASWEPALIQRGRHLVYGPAHCVSCHGDPDADEASALPALSGGRRVMLGIAGSIVAPNITSDPEHGIGTIPDALLARSLRYGIDRTGKRMLPVMSTAGLSDEDVQAILSFLRTTDAVSVPREVRRGLSPLGRFAVALGVPAQARPSARPPASVRPSRSAEYGRYVAESVAGCRGCHTARHPLTGRPSGVSFAGGSALNTASGTYRPPSLRGRTSVIRAWSQSEFVERFKTRARANTESPMPWRAYGRMTEDELVAVYRYLKALPDQ